MTCTSLSSCLLATLPRKYVLTNRWDKYLLVQSPLHGRFSNLIKRSFLFNWIIYRSDQLLICVCYYSVYSIWSKKSIEFDALIDFSGWIGKESPNDVSVPIWEGGVLTQWLLPRKRTYSVIIFWMEWQWCHSTGTTTGTVKLFWLRVISFRRV